MSALGGYGPVLAGAPSKVSVTITAAQLQALVGAPVQLLPAPAPNKRYVVFRVLAVYNPGATPFGSTPTWFLSWGNAGNYTLNLSTASIGPASTALNLAALIAREQQATITPAQGTPTTNTLGLGLFLFSTGTNLASGDGTVTFTIWYDLA